MEKIYGMHKLVGLQLFLSGTPTFSSGTPTFCQMGVLNSCFQNPSESSAINKNLSSTCARLSDRINGKLHSQRGRHTFEFHPSVVAKKIASLRNVSSMRRSENSRGQDHSLAQATVNFLASCFLWLK